MAVRVLTHAPALWGHMFYRCPNYSHAMQLSLETLALVGLSASKEYLLTLDPNVLYVEQDALMSPNP